MRPTRPSPVDVAGIILGTIAILVVVGSMAFIAQSRIRASSGLGIADFRSPRHGGLREENDQMVAGDFTTVEIRNIAGAIDIHAGDVEGVQVRSVKTGMFPGAMDNISVRIERQGARLLVEERHEGGFLASAGTVSFDVTVPPGVKTIEAHSVSGSVTVHDIPSRVDQKLTTISGSISTSRAGNLSASSTSGSIQFDFAGKLLNAYTVSGSIEGTIESLEPGALVSVRSVSGSVAVEAFPTLGAVVSLRSVSGGVSCEFPVTGMEQKRNSLEGSIGNGAARLDIATTSGPIAVRKM